MENTCTNCRHWENAECHNRKSEYYSWGEEDMMHNLCGCDVWEKAKNEEEKGMENLCDMFRCEIPYTAKKYCNRPYEGKCEGACRLGGPDCRRCLNERADICAKCVRSEDNRERVEE